VTKLYLKKAFLIALTLIASISSFCQTTSDVFNIKGKIKDVKNDEPITGVNVSEKGTTNGTVTDNSGDYILKLSEGKHILTFSFIGFMTVEKEILINSDKTLNIKLESLEQFINEIKVTSQRRFFGNMDYGRDLPSISDNVISKQNINNASDLLHTNVAGVWATKSSGAPGDQQKIRIRGQASFFSSAEPLYVIDGVPVPIVNLASLGISDLNINDIDKITVLKDASSSALYGFQGGNGVILIDTKKKADSPVSFKFKTGYQWFDNYYDLMGSEDFLSSLNLANKTIKSDIKNYYPGYSQSLCNNNSQKEVFKNGKLQEYQLSGGGNLGKVTYYLSGNYLNHKGIIEGSSLEKYSFMAHLGTTIKGKLAIDLSYRWNYQENINNQNEYMGNQIIFQGIGIAPCLECTPDSLLYNKQGILQQRTQVQYDLLNGLNTTRKIIDERNYMYSFFSNAGSLMARYEITNNLSVNIIESVMARNSIYDANTVFYNTYNKTYSYGAPAIFKSDESIALFNHQVNISYNASIKQHGFNVVLTHHYYADNLSWNVDSLKKNLPEHYYLRNSMAGHGKKGSVTRRIESFTGHLGYNYKETYFLSAIANLSRLKEGVFIDYFNLFPSLSISMDMSKLLFPSNNNTLNNFSIYANYGSSGNYPLNGLSNNLYTDVYFGHESEITKHPAISQFANHHLKNENTNELSFGIKSSFLSNRIKLNASVYSKKITDQIIMRDIPLYYGGGKIFLNIGDIEVRGFETDSELALIEKKNIKWIVNGNFFTSSQKVTKLSDNKDITFQSTDRLFPDFVISENGKLGDITGYKYLGTANGNAIPNDDVNAIEYKGIKYFNADTIKKGGNQLLTETDKVVIGNSIPDFNWNISSSLRYKEFRLDFVIYSSWGMEKFNSTRAATYITGVNREVNNFYLDSIPGIRTTQLYESSYFLEDASFIRLKSVTLSYSPIKKILGVNYSLSLSFENLFTYTKYKGYDPEATIYTDNNFSDNAVDRGAYPNPKSVFFTIELKL
jgi:TonB-linked SusC/RagA family outer membrane protein